MNKRIFDLVLTFILILLLFIPILLLYILHKIFYIDNFIFWSKRVGKNNKIFLMPKIRTMNSNTPDLATHLINNQNNYVTRLGSFLRLTSVDEIPQLWSILKGDMSFVGPRPALYNQNDLINLRNKYKINELIPGVTGLAQIKGRDSLSISKKVETEREYLKKKSFFFDIKIILITFIVVFKKSNIKH